MATELANALEQSGIETEVLDGDQVRQTISLGLGFSKLDRDENVRRIGHVAEALTHHGITVIVAAMSPFREARDKVRQQITSLPGRRFVEVHVDATVPVCRDRDVKELYSRFEQGAIKDLPGADLPYEAPLCPEVHCETGTETVDQSVGKILAFVSANVVALSLVATCL